MARKGIGEKESYLLASLKGTGKTIFSTDEAVETLKGGNRGAVNELLSGLVRKRWLIRLRKGLYLIVPLEAGPESKYTEHEFIVGSYLTKPYYVGFWSALNFHGFTEQVPMTVFIATTNSMRPRRILDVNYKFVKLSPIKMFGVKKYAILNSKINLSDREKTLVDCFGHPELCGGISEVLKPFFWKETIDYGKLLRYTKRVNGSALKRVGFVLDRLKLADPKPLLKEVKTGYVYLDPLGSKKKKGGKHSSKWNVIENIDLESIKKEVQT